MDIIRVWTGGGRSKIHTKKYTNSKDTSSVSSLQPACYKINEKKGNDLLSSDVQNEKPNKDKISQIKSPSKYCHIYDPIQSSCMTMEDTSALVAKINSQHCKDVGCRYNLDVTSLWLLFSSVLKSVVKYSGTTLFCQLSLSNVAMFLFCFTKKILTLLMNQTINQYKFFSSFSKSTRSSSSLLTIPVFLLCTSVFIKPVNTQCLPNQACYPNPADLLNTTYSQRTLSTSSTCGTNGTTTIYRKVTQNNVVDSTEYFCNATNPHPQDFMADLKKIDVLNITFDSPALSTYWQSDNTAVNNAVQTPVYIVVNLTDPFLIRFIRVIFVAPHVLDTDLKADSRPRAMAIDMIVEGDSNWQPRRYYAQSCPTSFPGTYLVTA